jgi:hypothetical protein
MFEMRFATAEHFSWSMTLRHSPHSKIMGVYGMTVVQVVRNRILVGGFITKQEYTPPLQSELRREDRRRDQVRKSESVVPNVVHRKPTSTCSGWDWMY